MSSDNALPIEGPDRYPLTPTLLAMIKAMQSAKALFIQEMIMFDQLELPTIADWEDRCETLFESDYRLISNHIGLVQNRQVLRAMLNVVVTSEVNETLGNMLPSKYIFDAWGNNGLGAITEKCMPVKNMTAIKSIDDLSPKDKEKLFSLASAFHFGTQESMSLESLTNLSEYGFVEKTDKEGYWQGTELLLSFIRGYY